MTWRTAMAAALLLLTATPAQAQWRGGGRDGWGAPRAWEAAQRDGGGGGDRGGRFAPGRPYGGGGRFGGYGPGGYGGGYGAPAPGYPPRFSGGPAGGAGGYGRPEGPGGYGGAASGLRRGQVLPPAYRGAYVPDPGRYHLRAAPPGYGWVGDGRDAYLTQRSTGLVLDRVPGAYEPAPAYRRGGGRGRGPR